MATKSFRVSAPTETASSASGSPQRAGKGAKLAAKQPAQSRSRSRQKDVLVVLGWYDHRLHRGVAEYALEHGWHLSANLARERVIPWGWQGDGVLAWLGAGDDLAKFVESTKAPTVDFSLRRAHLPYARVLQDHAHGAALVAEHFLARGFRNFLFFSETENWSYNERGRGFISALGLEGHACRWLKWNVSEGVGAGRDEWIKQQRWLNTELRRATKPVAIFAANDQLGVQVLESCARCGIEVPSQVAIVGAEDYLLAVDVMRTPLSSLDTNLEEQGYEGAALLDRLMNGESPPAEPIRVPAKYVVTRQSSDIIAVRHPQVARAVRFIREQFSRSIGVEDMVQATAMSRRGLHKAFLEHLGHPPGEELRRVRIEEAKRLLANTPEKIATVAELTGYQSANSFALAFRQATGQPPSGYRKTARSS